MSQDASLALDRGAPSVQLAGTAFLAVLAGHVFVDILATLVPATLGLFEVRLGLSPQQSAWILGIGPLFSGLCQPLCALVSDRLNSRSLGLVGVALGGLGIGALGLASNAVALGLVYAVGMTGIGMFHPVGAATAGHLRAHKRNSAMGIFFVAGMVGGVLGAIVWPRLLSHPHGFRYLPLVLVPTCALLVVIQRSFAQLGPPGHSAVGITASPARSSDWRSVALLYVATCLQFIVNMELVYLFVRWAQGMVALEHANWNAEHMARFAAPIVGDLNAAMILGMALGGLVSGFVVRVGREKLPLVLVPLALSPAIALFPVASLRWGYLLAMLGGMGFASMLPITIALAQRLLPQRANLASSLMMGGAWGIATIGPTLAEYGAVHWGLGPTFAMTAGTLALSGLACLPLSHRPH